TVFAFASFVPTQRFAMLMLGLLLLALVGDLVFLPAILLSPLGRLFRNSADRSPHPTGASQAARSLGPPPGVTSAVVEVSLPGASTTT
ncbi:MAG: hypothetical protein ACKOJF_15190, partial [Planctomycetaceae bacterium]